MNIAKTLKVLPIAAGICLAGLAVSQSAQAYVYAGSKLDITDLSVVLTPAAGTGVIVQQFSFTTTTSAAMNGVDDTSGGLTATCDGSRPVATNHDCATMGPVLTANAANAPGSETTRLNTDFALSGTTDKNYSNAGAQINTATLTSGGATPTSTSQVAEANLVANGTATADTTVTSNTTFAFIFLAAGDTTIDISFNAELFQFAEINNLSNGLSPTTSAEARYWSTVQANLSGGASAGWSPDGTLGGCGTNCAESTDTATTKTTTPGGVTSGALQATHSTTAFMSAFTGNQIGDPSSVLNSTGGPVFYSFQFTTGACDNNLGECSYQLDLATTAGVFIKNEVSAPATVALLGLGLVALGSRRRKKIASA